MRALFYSHDTLGLGHIRRCLALATSLTQRIDDLSVLIVTGSSAASSFALPPNVDLLKIPGLRKVENGRYVSRALHAEASDVRALREGLMRETMRVLEPEILYVDKDPLGPLGELEVILRENAEARAMGRGAITLLGLRDILDDPAIVREEWTARGTVEAIDHYYDRVLVYGMQDLYDLGAEYKLPPAVTAKTSYLGYIDPRERDQLERWTATQHGHTQKIVVTAGGGEDGFQIFSTYLRAARHLEVQHSIESTLVLGPDFPESSVELLELLASELTHRTFIVRFAEEMSYYLQNADLVVSMAGYNTMSEVLAYGKRAVVVPRVKPRIEQLLRAERLARRGLVSFVHPDQLSDQALADAVSRGLSQTLTRAADGAIDLSGLERTAAIVSEMLPHASEVRCA
jgi:predicted glycosyltransferase